MDLNLSSITKQITDNHYFTTANTREGTSDYNQNTPL